MTAEDRRRCAHPPACRFYAIDGSEFCRCHDPALAEQRRAEMSERGRNGRAKQIAGKQAPRSSVPLSTPQQIREYLERIAALVESASGGKVERANAAVKVAQAAAALLKDELEKQADEIRRLLERYDELQKDAPTQ